MHDETKSEEAKRRLTFKWSDLKREYHLRFRYNFEQGMLECLIPIAFHYVFGTFDLDWSYTQNLTMVYVIMLLTFFRW